jgi:hypothetical protein
MRRKERRERRRRRGAIIRKGEERREAGLVSVTNQPVVTGVPRARQDGARSDGCPTFLLQSLSLSSLPDDADQQISHAPIRGGNVPNGGAAVSGNGLKGWHC